MSVKIDEEDPLPVVNKELKQASGVNKRREYGIANAPCLQNLLVYSCNVAVRMRSNCHVTAFDDKMRLPHLTVV